MGNKCMRAPDLEHNQPKVQSKPAIDKNYLQVNKEQIELLNDRKNHDSMFMVD